jgi:HAE1 family hydrophobic/amphiphilic exporter-1
MVTIIMALSLVTALTLTPMMGAKMMRLNKDTKYSRFDKWYNKNILPLLDKLDSAYSKLVNKATRKRSLTLGVIIVVFIVGIGITAVTLKTEFISPSDNNAITMSVEMPTGTRMELARETGHKITRLIQEKYPEVEISTFTVGLADEDNLFGSLQDNGSNIMNFNIRTKEAKLRNKTIFDISDELRTDLAAMPEISKYVVTPGGITGIIGASNISVDIYGHDLAETDQLAAQMKTKLEGIEGLRDVTISRKDYRIEYRIEFDREKLSLNGLNIATAGGAVRNSINGLTTSYFREEGEEYDIRVRFDEEHRQTIEDIENIVIYNPMGVGIRVRDVGRVEENSSLPQIDRKDRQRIVTVQGTIYKRALSEIVKDVNVTLASLDVPSGVQVEISGSLEDQQDAFSDLGLLLIIVFLLVYIVLASQFESLTYPFIIIMSIPFAFIGALLLLSSTGSPLGIMGFIGLIMLVGIVVKNGIVLVDYINLNRERGMSIITAVVHAAKSRLRPVLMTTFTTILAMIPLAIGTGQGSELWQQLGLTIIGGMTFSTIVTLILVPALYSIFGGNGVKRRRRKHREEIHHQNGQVETSTYLKGTEA